MEGAGAGGGCSGAPRRDPPNAACSLTSVGLLSYGLGGRRGRGSDLSYHLLEASQMDSRSPGTPRWCWVCFRLAGLCTPCGRDSSIRAFLQGTLVERLQCGLRRASGPIEHPDSSELPFRGAQANGNLHSGLLSSASRCPGKATCIPKRLNNCVE